MVGTITTERTIWCGSCAEWDQKSDEPRMAAAWRKAGWRLTRKRGWLCPACAKKEAGQKR